MLFVNCVEQTSARFHNRLWQVSKSTIWFNTIPMQKKNTHWVSTKQNSVNCREIEFLELLKLFFGLFFMQNLNFESFWCFEYGIWILSERRFWYSDSNLVRMSKFDRYRNRVFHESDVLFGVDTISYSNRSWCLDVDSLFSDLKTRLKRF